MKFIYLISITLFSVSSFAAKKNFSCPETHPEYTKVLSELKSFKDKLAENLECKDFSVKFDKLTGLLGSKGRKDFISLVSSNTGETVSAESAQKIQDYAGSVTEEVATLISLVGAAASGEGSILDIFTGTDKCRLDEEDEFEGIERLTKAAYEATNLISKVAGPYGVPLQIGANTFFGVVQGLKSYSERKTHINFDAFEKRQFFESAVCMMTQFNSDIRELNNPEGHLSRLKKARSEASRVVNTVRLQCENCASLSSPIVQKINESKENLDWIDKEIAKFTKIVNFESGGIGPRELESLRSTVDRFLLGTAAPDFLSWYAADARMSNKKFFESVRAASHSMRSEFRKNGVEWSKELPESLDLKSFSYSESQKRRNYILATPEILNLYFMTLNYKNFNRLSPTYYSLLGDAHRYWKLSDVSTRVVQEYCSFFENTFQYTRVKSTCEQTGFVVEALRTAYHAFYLADLINADDSLERLGPFDFRLDDHFNYIDKYTELSGRNFVLADAGLDFANVLARDRGIRLADGRLKSANDNSSDSADWWSGLSKKADDFIQGAQVLGHAL